MSKIFSIALCASAALLAPVSTGLGFALLGPFDTWQTEELYYQGGDGEVYDEAVELGGPQNLGEEYRWTIPTIYYGMDATFLNFFGLRGRQEVDKAMDVLNDLPKFSEMSDDLSDYPLQSSRMNYRASQLLLFDLKSQMLSHALDFLGVANPERFTWTLRARAGDAPIFDYTIVNRNFDPVTWEPSRYVNGALYTFRIMVQIPPAGDWSDAQEQLVDPTQEGWTSVAGAYQGLFFPSVGAYYNALTRDDVGALRYIYRKDNYNVEQMGPTVLGGSSGGPWTPVTTNIVDPGVISPDIILRQGVDKLTFVRRDADSLLGTLYIPITNSITSVYVTNGVARTQQLRRVVQIVDLAVAALGTSDLGSGAVGFRRHTKANNGYVNSQTLIADGGATIQNGSVNGPGFRVPPPLDSTDFGGQVLFSKLVPEGFASGGFFLSERNMEPYARWATYDGSTNAPIVYPNGASIRDIEAQVLGDGN